MAENKKLVAVALIGGGVYYLYRSGALDALLGGLSLDGRSTVALTPEQQAYVNTQKAAAIELAQIQERELVEAKARSGAGAIAFTAAGVGTAASLIGAGIASSSVAALGALAITGYGAAAGLLIWGITKKGWFRGGEEGVAVNPARDQFIDVWVCTFYGDPKSFTRDEITERRYFAMVKSFEDAGVPNQYISPTIAQLYAADTMKEFEAAATNYLDVMRTHGSNVNWTTVPSTADIVCASRT